MKTSKEYQVIYADPPWRYDFSKSSSRDIENQYPTMKTEDIANLMVPSAKDSVLYLWATAPKLREALRVMEVWGFEYKSHAIWDKQLFGMGYWFRGQHELLLIGTKGKFSPPAPELRRSSVFSYRRARHSKKPDEIRDYLTSLYPALPKIELFARTRSHGWDSWGNELDAPFQLPLAA